MKTSDKIMSAISDETISDAIATAASDAGVELGDDAVAQITQAVRQALREMIDRCENEAGGNSEMQTMIRREVQRFWRQIGGRPNGYRTL